MSNMRDDLELAIADVDDENEENDAQTAAAEKTTVQEGHAENIEENTGVLQAEIGETDTTTGAVNDETESVQATADSTDSTPDSAEAIAAPNSWPPATREKWSELPQNVQSQVVKREREIVQALEKGKEQRKTGQRFSEITDKYASVIAAEGVTDPVKGFESLMQVMATLRMGTAEQKAQRISGFMQAYGVTPEQMGFTRGETTPQQQHESQLASMVDQRMQPVNALLQQMQNQQHNQFQQTQQQQTQDIQSFADSNEFFEDVKSDMADLIDLTAQRGGDITMKSAYQKACALNPEIAGILSERSQKEVLLAGKKNLADKQQAASSISGRQAGTGSPEGSSGMSMRQMLEDQWDAAG